MGLQYFGRECHVWNLLELRHLEASWGGAKERQRWTGERPSLDLIPWYCSCSTPMGKDITLGNGSINNEVN